MGGGGGQNPLVLRNCGPLDRLPYTPRQIPRIVDPSRLAMENVIFKIK